MTSLSSLIPIYRDICQRVNAFSGKVRLIGAASLGGSITSARS